ncbi:MAG: CHAD domain-containing protein [Pirellulales bacterium]
MNEHSKWADEVSPTDRVAKAAERILRARLIAVEDYLRRAGSGKQPNEEDVHQCRVWTRRSIAAVEFFSPLIRRKDTKWLLKQLKKIRKSAGEARDDDVLLLRLADAGVDPQSGVYRRVKKHRRRAQRPLRATHSKLIVSDKFARRVGKSLRRLRKSNRGNRTSFATWADQRVHRTLRKFFATADALNHDPAALHKFRVHSKKLRYTMELTVGVYPVLFRDELYPQIEQLQARLGELNDHAVAKQRYARWNATANGEVDHAELGSMIDQESDELAASLRDFAAWWTEDRKQSLRDGFQRCLGSETF